MNPIRFRVQAAVAAAIAEAKVLGVLKHPGVVGTAREILVERIVRPVTTPDVQFGSGQLVDSKGNVSGQLDVTIYSPLILPPGLFDARNGIFPAESCLYAIEVKSRLSLAEVRKSVASAKRVASLTYRSTERHSEGSSKAAECPLPIVALFAFASDLKGDPARELERLRAEQATNSISVLCVVGRGYWYATNDGWIQFPATSEHDEVLNFMSGTASTIPKFLSAKGRPKFGGYIGNESGATKVGG